MFNQYNLLSFSFFVGLPVVKLHRGLNYSCVACVWRIRIIHSLYLQYVGFKLVSFSPQKGSVFQIDCFIRQNDGLKGAYLTFPTVMLRDLCSAHTSTRNSSSLVIYKLGHTTNHNQKAINCQSNQPLLFFFFATQVQARGIILHHVFFRQAYVVNPLLDHQAS